MRMTSCRPKLKKIYDLGKDVQDSSRITQLIACDKEKEPIAPDDVDPPADNEISLGSSLS